MLDLANRPLVFSNQTCLKQDDNLSFAINKETHPRAMFLMQPLVPTTCS